MFSLGTWQLQRLQWKKELILQISKSYDKAAQKFEVNSKLYSKVKIEGKIIAQPILVHNLGNKGQYGYDVYIPIETNEIIILTRAGWIEKKFKFSFSNLNVNISLDAILLKPKRKNIFTPDNSDDLIFFIDMKTLQLNFQKKLLPLIAENRSNSFEKYNLKKPDKIELPNNHLQYALTWYSLCFVIIIAFLIYKRKI